MREAASMAEYRRGHVSGEEKINFPLIIKKSIAAFLKMLLNGYFKSLLRKTVVHNKAILGKNFSPQGKIFIADFNHQITNYFYLKGILEKGFTSSMKQADAALIWGTDFKPKRIGFIRKALKNNIPVITVEDGFIRSLSVGVGKKCDPGFSWILDHQGIYHDYQLGSSVRNFLDSDWIISPKELDMAKKAIAFIIENSLSKYNLSLPKNINFNLDGIYSSVVLVIDQRRGDSSVVGSGANAYSFKKMLKDSIAENPNSLVLVKIHPDAIVGQKRGYFTNLALKNVQILSRNINPISLLRAVDKVYTVSSQMGMEGIMLNKKVYCYGWPFYSGWGLTVDRDSGKSGVSKRRSFEEVFFASYIKYSYYFNPEKHQSCNIFEGMEYIVKERKRLRNEATTTN